jgi:hypothetical protein
MRLLLMCLALCGVAHAGDRQVEILLVNMTPDSASSAASKQCVKAIEKKLGAEYTHLARLGETALRKLVGKTAGEPFLGWPLESLKPAKERGETFIDALVLIDCRPEGKTLDVLVSPPAKGLTLLTLRSVTLDAALTDLVADAIFRRGTAGFSP